MMKCKRIFAFVASAVLAVTALTGCHGSKGIESFSVENAAAGDSAFDENKNYEITFWAKNDTNKLQTEIYKKAIADFEKIYPNIKVNLRLYTDYSKIYNDIITNISTGTTPNVCITYPDHIATYISGSNIVIPLDDLMVDEEYGLGGSKVKFDSPKKEQIVKKFLDECKLNDVTYALPYMRSTEACYVNKTFVEKLGYELPDKLTWDFVWEVSEAATAKDSNGKYKVNNQEVMIPFIYKSTDNMMIQMTEQLQSGYSTEEGEVLLFNDTTKEILDEVANHVKNGAFSTFKISSYPANFLNAGQCIFAIDSTAGSTWMGSDAPLCDIPADSIVEFETVVYPVPQYDVDNPKMISQGPSVCVFNKADSGEVLASWLFTQFLLTNSVQNAYSKTEGYVPVSRKAIESIEYQNYLSMSGKDGSEHYRVKVDATRMLLANTDNTFVTPVFNGSTSLRNASGQLIEETVKSVRRGQVVDDKYYTKLFDEVTALYRLDSVGRVTSAGKTELGPMPKEAIALIYALIVIWICIIAYVIYYRRKLQKNSQ